MMARRISLGELGNWGSGGTPLASRADYYGGDIPWLIIEDLNDGFVDRAARTITRLGLENSSAKIVPPGTLLIAMYGSIGKLGIPRIECATNQAIAYCKCDPAKVDTRFLFHLLLNERGRFLRAGRGGTQQNINQEFLRDYEVLLPSLSEQQRIAGLLEQADRLLRTRRYALELSDSFLPAIFLELFGRANPQSASWPGVGLTELCEHEDDIRCGPFGTQLNRGEFQRSGVPLWGIKHVNTGFQLGTDEFVSKSKSLELDTYSLLPGDLVMTRKGTIGNCALYPMHFPPGIMHSDLLRIRLKAGAVSSVFLNHQLHYSSRIKRQIDLISGGAVMAGINVGMLKSIRIQLPPMELQQHFSWLVSKHERLRAIQREALHQAEHLFQTLLHQAFSESMSC
jgi:type I restriction enzyme S subunit